MMRNLIATLVFVLLVLNNNSNAIDDGFSKSLNVSENIFSQLVSYIFIKFIDL